VTLRYSRASFLYTSGRLQPNGNCQRAHPKLVQVHMGRSSIDAVGTRGHRRTNQGGLKAAKARGCSWGIGASSRAVSSPPF
jgi:hypothetical protein